MAQGKFLGRGVAQPTDTCGTLFNKTGWLSPAVFGHFRVGVLYSENSRTPLVSEIWPFKFERDGQQRSASRGQ